MYTEIQESQVPSNATVINSHVAHKTKVIDDGPLKLKARICPLGNRDKDKDGIRKDIAAVQFPKIRFMLRISALLGFRLGTVDISAAYLQSGSITGSIFVQPL